MSQLTDIITLDRPLVSLDLETTGTDPKTDRIVQIGICKLYPDGKYTEWQTLVNPGVQLSAEVEAFFAEHGGTISNAVLNGCAVCGKPPGVVVTPVAADFVTNCCTCELFTRLPSFADIAPMLYAGLSNCDLAGYNLATFDVPLLKAEFARVNAGAWTPGRIVDGYKLVQRAHPRNLAWFVETYAGPTGDFQAHDALHDARQTLRGLLGFFQQHEQFPRDVQQLHDMFFVAPRDANSLDPDGKIVWRGGEACIAFGKKHNGKTLREVQALDPGYLKWIMAGEFSGVVKEICRMALDRKFPIREARA